MGSAVRTLSAQARGMQPRVVYVVDCPPSDRDVARFGLDILQRAGLTVTIWDLSPLWRIGNGDLDAIRSGDGRIRSFSHHSQLQAEVSRLESSDALILMDGPFLGAVFRRRRALRQLSRSRARWTLFVGAPQPASGMFSNMKAHTTWARIVRWSRAPLRWAVAALLYVEVGCVWPKHLRAFDDVWYATSLEGVFSGLLDRSTRLHAIHALDYDQVLDLPADFASEGRGIVFIDSMGPLHPDYKMQGMLAPQSVEEFGALVAHGLSLLEDYVGMKTIVAAHPRAVPGEIEEMYQGREVAYGETLSLIAGSALVVCAEGSTALGMAVVLGKPIYIMQSSTFPLMVRKLNEGYIEALEPGVLDLDSSRFSKEDANPCIDRYRRFSQTYIKLLDTPEVPFWAYVAEQLKMGG